MRVGNHVIQGGLIYVGSHLPKRGSSYENENCLINPQLPIGWKGDPLGATMGYWPAYATISQDARKSYLEWLSGPRSDPAAYIGYVFLYFYGLERRLLLDEAATDSPQVVAEVRRLLSIYGGNGSFRRYATALLGAYQLLGTGPDHSFALDFANSDFDIPITIKIALGQRLESGTPVEPDLLLAYVMAHPETQVRTPAKRVDQALLKRMFARELERRFPKGIKIVGKAGRKLRLDYHACSGSFDREIKPFGLDLIDVTERKQPIGDARAVFEACVDMLDGYSRALGKSDGMKPTLAAVAKLPAPYRQEEAQRLAGDPVARLEKWSLDGALVRIDDVAALAGMPTDKPVNRTYVADVSSALASIGFGHTGNPDFATRWPKAGETVVLFPLRSAVPAAPSDSYKTTQLMVLLGLLMAFADGELQPEEQTELDARIDMTPGLSGDEKCRLKAELKVYAADPARLDEFAKKLKDVDPASRERIADTLVAMAAADGSVHPDEVRQLEKLFRIMSFDRRALYARLHEGAASARSSSRRSESDDVPEIIPASETVASTPIPPPPPAERKAKPAIMVDASRLQAIREETRVAAGLLAEIFADEPEPAAEISPVMENELATEGELFEGLERRYGSLLLELRERGEWAASEFARLAREAGLMPAAVFDVLNNWALDLFDELLLEGDDPVIINLELLPNTSGIGQVTDFEERALS